MLKALSLVLGKSLVLGIVSSSTQPFQRFDRKSRVLTKPSYLSRFKLKTVFPCNTEQALLRFFSLPAMAFHQVHGVFPCTKHNSGVSQRIKRFIGRLGGWLLLQCHLHFQNFLLSLQRLQPPPTPLTPQVNKPLEFQPSLTRETGEWPEGKSYI